MLPFSYMSPLSLLKAYESKYSESCCVSYKHFQSDGSDRVPCYRDFYYAGNSPINITLVPKIEDMLFEPHYQMLRQTLLATQIVETGIPDVDCALVVHVYAKANREFTTIPSPALRQFGRDAYDAWRHILVEPSDFVLLTAEDLFKTASLKDYPELEPWALYLSQRYSFLK